MVRVAAWELEKAVDLLELAEERHAEHLEKSTATIEPLRKLRGKEGVRSASWTLDWQSKLFQMDKGVERLESVRCSCGRTRWPSPSA